MNCGVSSSARSVGANLPYHTTWSLCRVVRDQSSRGLGLAQSFELVSSGVNARLHMQKLPILSSLTKLINTCPGVADLRLSKVEEGTRRLESCIHSIDTMPRRTFLSLSCSYTCCILRPRYTEHTVTTDYHRQYGLLTYNTPRVNKAAFFGQT